MSLQLNQLTIFDKFTCDLFNSFVDELSVNYLTMVFDSVDELSVNYLTMVLDSVDELSVNYLTMVFDSVDEFTSICGLSNDSVEVCTCELNSFSLISLTATQ